MIFHPRLLRNMVKSHTKPQLLLIYHWQWIWNARKNLKLWIVLGLVISLQIMWVYLTTICVLSIQWYNYSNCLKTPTRIEKSKYLRCYCCKSGPITCRCWLPKRGYLPGETLSFSAEIENLSTLNMRGSELKLVQVNQNYYSNSEWKERCETLQFRCLNREYHTTAI